ncbi:MAG TPA: DUF4097 family beta strand repeat-containing protein [Acetivibrio sp.]|uniref:DUF4097 family beta strand repeat-containing protein n=1 Tax=Acetivibrio sp. TaxID=1872092 RepID=UPI002C86C8C6|nr:DUF4097 family beta strand repeat-containing protein [Acetivibrio sp.]HOM02961.1 DUF4097 family beta strand repeat-containing protein [Acetivibrio sp.]
MSISEERMFILKMLEEGKISSEEAARLLEAIDPNKGATDSSSGFKAQQKRANFSDEVSKVKDKLNEWKKEFKKNYSQKDFERAVDEFSTKVEKLGKNLAYTTIGVADKLVDFVSSFVETNSFNVFGKYKATNRVFETADVNEDTELSVEAINGHILVKKHMDNKVIIRTTVKSPVDNADEIFDFSKEENKIALKCNKIGNISVSHEIFLPAVKFKNINLVTKNGKIYVEDSTAENFEAVTSNSNVDLMGVTGDKINVSTKNGRINFGYIIGKDINVDAINSVIEIRHLKTSNLNASTKNGRIFVENVHNHNDDPNINMNLKTSSAGIKVNMNDMEKRGYKVKAQTTNAEINILIPEMTYRNISKQMASNFVEADSNGYDEYANKVNIVAETTSGNIEIVK